ncbi:MAG: nucleotidyltransferase [Clostridia bacterium]|nr:nucleotidyltransferase [Clostridia bacterium]
MKVLAIVSEYNPFHNGHLYHLRESIKMTDADYTICVMGGNFLQRGEPALFDKWIRTEAAVKSGIDVVFELPAVFACSSAEYFAGAAVKIINGLGCVTHISFGSEHGNIQELLQIAETITYQPETYQSAFKKHMAKGLSYAQANQLSLEGMSHLSHIAAKPNNILGIEYLKALLTLESAIIPITVKRKDAQYHDTSIGGNICSATAIRNQLKQNQSFDSLSKVIPSDAYDHLQKYISSGVKPLFLSDFFQLIQYKILTSGLDDLQGIYSTKEGLEYRIMNYIRKSENLEELIKNIKTKRYVQTSIQRLLIHILLNISKQDVKYITEENCLYGRILGFSSKGSELIRHIKEKATRSIPIISNINKEIPKNSSLHKLLKYDIAASDLYYLVSNQSNLYAASDYVRKPFIGK